MYEYRSQKELYEGLIPAINVKMKMLKRGNYSFIDKEDIWNYLKENKWKVSVDLTLADMVHDIIHVDHSELARFVENKKAIKEGDE